MSELDEKARLRELVSVKPLEWVWSEVHSTWYADSVLGESSYRAWEVDGTACVIRPGDRAGVVVGKTVDAAKAAAQSHYETRVLSALSEKQPEDEGWREIETAPKDGTVFLALYPAEGARPFWVESTSWPQDIEVARYYGLMIGGIEPTHWHPLPAPPVQP